MLKIVYCSLFLLFFHLVYSCNEWYNHPLGNNLSLWDGDREEDRVIVYCEGNCHGGIYVVPAYDRHYDSSGHYAEFVKTAKSDRKWVIAKTIQIKGKQENYWIISKDFKIKNLDCSKINCDSTLQRQVSGPLTFEEFQHQRRQLNIDLEF